MIASGLVMAAILALPWISSVRVREESFVLQLVLVPACVLAGLAFGLSYTVGKDPVVQGAAAIVLVAGYWLVTTAILGRTIEAVRRLTTGWTQAPPGGARTNGDG